MGKKRLSLSELSCVWSTYLNNSMDIQFKSYALNVIENEQIKKFYQEVYQTSDHIYFKMEDLLLKNNTSLPVVFSEEDVHAQANKLFSDEFFLYYMYIMLSFGIQAYSLAFTTIDNADIQNLFHEMYLKTTEHFKRSKELLNEFHLSSRLPDDWGTSDTEFVEQKNFLNGWIGKKRPINVIEATSIYYNLQKSVVIKALTLGFMQTTKSKEVKDILSRAFHLAEKHVQTFHYLMDADHLPTVISLDSHVTNSTETVFSDRFILGHLGNLMQSAMGYYGSGLSVTMRRDIAKEYETAILGIGLLSEDIAELMIKKHWLFQPPYGKRQMSLK